MIKNASTYTEFVIRPTGGDLTQDKSWGVNAHVDWSLRIEGWMD
jgi:hypothetical protein